MTQNQQYETLLTQIMLTFGAVFASAANELEIININQNGKMFIYKHGFKKEAKELASRYDRFCNLFRKQVLAEGIAKGVNMDEAFEYLDNNTLALFDIAVLLAQLSPEEVRDVVQNLHEKVMTKYKQLQPCE